VSWVPTEVLRCFPLPAAKSTRFAAAGLLARFLCRLERGDPIGDAIAARLLSAAVVAACIIPARRAASVDPVVALRAE